MTEINTPMVTLIAKLATAGVEFNTKSNEIMVVFVQAVKKDENNEK